MTADVLRQAASLMRERAEAATWVDFHGKCDWAGDVASLGLEDDFHSHIASWHPAVALAVADWLEVAADRADTGFWGKNYQPALAVAHAYLGTT